MIELLVVIVIMGVPAAIAIPMDLGQHDRANVAWLEESAYIVHAESLLG